ncbi:hypothetical protein GUITHDRAFT_143877 [Guillardia theta CCMP2712]|uniref:Uncharacterized protein n=2 Tax=Guillardia theta TaxID=55529 RepID=L1IRH2_GUITC|nr:hypothetical protein GUITHDRAFT_143877 [Guillardia theta CCMP2712]EKX38861.1 hypothetical protein GUITHDRAFT_143877 [Guillardia theta CCMP2712]|eukprot:XP_005825841.1 hypothetical protein GUITHDRAFT_143877 [Guillardia theta CCMP2712]
MEEIFWKHTLAIEKDSLKRKRVVHAPSAGVEDQSLKRYFSMSSAARRHTKRVSKQGERARTHALHTQLDEMVPLRRAPEGGKLQSKRTVSQLLEDTVAHVRNERMRGSTSERKEVKEDVMEEEEVVVEEEGQLLSGDMLLQGMLSSRSCNFMVLNLDTLKILSASRSASDLFQAFTLCPLLGMNILFMVHHRDVAVVQEYLQSFQGDRERGAIEASVLTFQGSAGIAYVTFKMLITKAVDSERRFLFLELHREETVRVHKPDTMQMMSIDLQDWTSFDFQRFAGVFRFDDFLSQGSPWDLDEQTSELIGRNTKNPSLWSHMSSSFMRNQQVGALIRRISSEVGLQIARLVKMMLQFHCAVEVDEHGTPFFVTYVRMKLPSYLGSFKLDWFELLRIDLNGTPKKVPGSANLQTATFIHQKARKGTLAFSQFLFYEEGGGLKCYQTKLLELDSETMQICYSGDCPAKFRNVLVKVEDLDPRVYPSMQPVAGGEGR